LDVAAIKLEHGYPVP